MTAALSPVAMTQFAPSPGGHGYPGRLIVIEGGDRSGRSTQVELLSSWLKARKLPVVQTDWSTSPHISKAIHKAKVDTALRTVTFSLFYAADFADRIANVVVPALERAEVVVADRYVYTAFARDSARGAAQNWLRKLYDFAPQPDAVFYLDVPPEVRRQREPSAAVKARDIYEFGLDLGLTSDPERSFDLYQQRVYEQFRLLVEEFRLTSVDGELPVEVVQKMMQDAISAML